MITYETLVQRLVTLEREHRLLIGNLIGTPVVCSFSICTRRDPFGMQVPAPHAYLWGECYPKGEEAEKRAAGQEGACWRCKRQEVGIWWWGLPRAWEHTTEDAVTWKAAWLCGDCRRLAADLDLRERVMPEASILAGYLSAEAIEADTLAASRGHRMHLDGCVGPRDHPGKCWFHKVKDGPQACPQDCPCPNPADPESCYCPGDTCHIAEQWKIALREGDE